MEFFDWLEAKGVTQLTAVESVHVAAYIEQLQKARSAPTAKLRLAALRHLFDWMVIGQIMPVNPASAVRGPRHIVRRGKTPVLDPAEARQLIDAIDASTVIGLRDRALIGLMVYSFARIGAAIAMRVEDAYPQNRRLCVRLHEKGGKEHAMPCHHNLEPYLHEYLDGAGRAADLTALLFQTYRRTTGQLTGNPLPQANAYAMIQRRAKAAGVTTQRPSRSWGRYAARRCWPCFDCARAMWSCSNVPFITDVRTLSMKCAPLGDQRICCLAVILRWRSLWTALAVCAVEIGSPERRAAA